VLTPSPHTAATHHRGICVVDWTHSSLGRRPLLYLCFAARAARGVLFALVTNPCLVVAIQVLDGVSAAIPGVTLPLIVADITRGTGRFNLGLGNVGTAVSIGAALTPALAGYSINHF
jgi:hypothetical protein